METVEDYLSFLVDYQLRSYLDQNQMLNHRDVFASDLSHLVIKAKNIYGETLKVMCHKLNLTPFNIEGAFNSIMDELFQEKKNNTLEQLVMFFAFSGEVASHFVNNN